MSNGLLRQYLGDGKGTTLAQRKGTFRRRERQKSEDDPAKYLASDELRAAVNVALVLGQPLLLTGDPGTGKTELAKSVAWELGLELLTFGAKTTSTARDLLYRYDAMRHFYASRSKDVDALPYVEAEAFGQAVLLTRPEGVADERVDALLPAKLRMRDPQRSVVLLDEVDKAPRDFPNDLLVEIDKKQFRILETGDDFVARKGFEPIVILTSNSEKNLPDAFLRRCVFHHIRRPDAKQLRDILEARLGAEAAAFAAVKNGALDWFVRVRDTGGLAKAPATSEFLEWVWLLREEQVQISDRSPDQDGILRVSCSVLAKTEEDLKKLQAEMGLQQS